MKIKQTIVRLIAGVALIASVGSGVSCMTTYDSYGRPVQSVDPGLAVAGVAAAGLVGYAIANDNDDHHPHYYPRRGGYYRGGRYYR
jgi:hypothetical protein